MTSLICIRGQARTWNWIKGQVIPLLDRVAGVAAHWLWISPKTSTVSEESLARDFQGRAHSIIWVSEDAPKNLDSYTSMAYYDYLALPTLLDLAPDQVIFTRPDLLLFDGQGSREPLRPRELRGWYPSLFEGQRVTSDFYCRAGAEAAALLMNRWLDQEIIDEFKGFAQTQLAEYIVKNNLIGHCGQDHNRGTLANYIVRPTDLENAPKTVPLPTNQDTNWIPLPPPLKLHWCTKYNIDPRDYGM